MRPRAQFGRTDIAGDSATRPPLVVTPQQVAHLQGRVGNRAVAALLRDSRRQADALRAAPPSTPSRVRPAVQRAMKLEIQVPGNKLWRNDGRNPRPLPRKFGPKDVIVEGASGIRLESETRGQLEFETGWHRKWSAIRKRLRDAVAMTKRMNAAETRPSGRRAFPFPVPHLRTGTRRERRRGRWQRIQGKKRYERNPGETILGPSEALEVELGDPTWNASFQTSESFELKQYESFFRQHEFPAYTTPGTAAVDRIMAKVVTPKLPAKDAENLRNFLLIIVNYVQRGQGGPKAKATATFEDVEGMPSKQAFLLLSRTDFASMYRLLSRTERQAFKRLVGENVIAHALGVGPRARVYVKGYGTDQHHAGPTVRQWLRGIIAGKDLLSTRRRARRAGRPERGGRAGISGAQGRHKVDKRRGKKHTGLVRFEARGSRTGHWETADKWEQYARRRFLMAFLFRNRKGSTRLVP